MYTCIITLTKQQTSTPTVLLIALGKGFYLLHLHHNQLNAGWIIFLHFKLLIHTFPPKILMVQIEMPNSYTLTKFSDL